MLSKNVRLFFEHDQYFYLTNSCKLGVLTYALRMSSTGTEYCNWEYVNGEFSKGCGEERIRGKLGQTFGRRLRKTYFLEAAYLPRLDRSPLPMGSWLR